MIGMAYVENLAVIALTARDPMITHVCAVVALSAMVIISAHATDTLNGSR